MIIFEEDVPRFIELAHEPWKLASIIKFNMRERFGINIADNELRSWEASLPEVARLLSSDDRDLRKVLCEFNLPTSRKRIDFVILGKDAKGKPSAWIIELKQWSQVQEAEWNNFRIGRYHDSHPSDQARDYAFRLEHEMGLEDKVHLKSSAYLHNLKTTDSPLFKDSYRNIMQVAKLYHFHNREELGRDINSHTIIHDGSKALSYFQEAKWSPTQTFMEIVANNCSEIQLVGSQQLIYDRIINFVKQWNKEDKMTFLISGDPGSGKTLVAFKIALAFMGEFGINVQLMIPGQELRSAFEYQMRRKALSSIISGAKVRDHFDAAIIDEGHKAIGRDTGDVNYHRNYKKLNFAIILIDDDQVINRKGITKDQVMQVAKKAGHSVHEYKIEENFRNAGERALLDWIDFVIYQRETMNGEFVYRQEKYINKNMHYKLHGYKIDHDFVAAYHKCLKDNRSTRITSLWHSEFHVGSADENGNVPKTVPIGSYRFAWNPNMEWWNKIVDERDRKTYSREVHKWIESRESFLINHDALRPEYIAYFNHIQGYEFDHIFVYIPNVFTYENGQLIFHRDRLAKEVLSSQTWAPNSKSAGLGDRDPYELNKGYFLNRIKVMLTRGTKSTHVFAEDSALNNYLRQHIED